MELTNNKENLTNRFVDYIWEFTYKEISPATKAEIKLTLVDYLGAFFAGANIGKLNTQSLLNLMEGEGNTSPIGVNQKVSLENAALVNGILAHYAELDDGHRMGLLHPGAVIFSSLFAWHQKYPIDEASFYKAVLVGYEASIRLAQSAQPSAKLNGFHGTGIFGTIGAALACAIASKTTKKQLKNTLAAATTTASGILRVIKNTSQLKPFNAGNASKNAVTAALMGKAGFEGPIEVLDGELGFLKMYDENFKREVLYEENSKPKLFEIYRKPYASCRHCHPAIDLALIFRNEIGVEYKEIETVDISTYGIGIPGHEHTEILGINSAKMSTPYSFAVALCTGKAGLAQFEKKYFEQNEIKQLTKKVTVIPNGYFDEHYPKKRGAEIKLKTHKGEIHILKADLPKGEPETALSPEEIKTKFFELSVFSGIENETATKIFDLCTNTNFNIDIIFEELQNLNLLS